MLDVGDEVWTIKEIPYEHTKDCVGGCLIHHPSTWFPVESRDSPAIALAVWGKWVIKGIAGAGVFGELGLIQNLGPWWRDQCFPSYDEAVAECKKRMGHE